MILTEYSENCLKIAYFHSVFYSSLNVKTLKKNEEFVEAITFCKIQSFIKHHIFECLSPYDILLTWFRQNIPCMSIKFTLEWKYSKQFIFSTPYAPHIRQDTRQENINHSNEVLLIHLRYFIRRMWFVGPPSMRKPFWDRQDKFTIT